MRIVVTGTPGTGKTTACGTLDTDLTVVSLNDRITEYELIQGQDSERNCWIADLEAVRSLVRGWDDVVIESHLAHHVEADRVVVLRCRPDLLETRLLGRGVSRGKAKENAETEALDVILWEAVDRHGTDAIYEIDITLLQPDEVGREIEAVIRGEREPSVGTVTFIEYA